MVRYLKNIKSDFDPFFYLFVRSSSAVCFNIQCINNDTKGHDIIDIGRMAIA